MTIKTSKELKEYDVMRLKHTAGTHYLIFIVKFIDKKLIFIEKIYGMPMDIKENEVYPIMGNIKENPDLLDE